ncbi:MAG: winged helix-turn-helix domain-containing protein [Paracoccaceae bacterium]
MNLPLLPNPAARRLFLHRHALAEPPTGPAKGAELLALIRRLGFVQVDSINTVERAHHMILWSRRQTYRPDNLRPLLERDRTLFEHWTHDASVIPAEFLPHWRLRFARDAARIRDSWAAWQGNAFHDRIDEVLAHVRATGPVGTGEVGTDEVRSKGGWWEWHPSKTALEYLWRSGMLAVCHRKGFAKYYDLTERVFPEAEAGSDSGPQEAETIDWACAAALDRLGFATSGEIAAFYRIVSPEEAKAWCARGLQAGDLSEILVEGADGTLRKHVARPDVLARAEATPEPFGGLRVLSPFDPALRDRNRAARLFGFHYRIEVFVPEPKRTFGYYVFPVLEGDRIVGRLDARANRAGGALAVRAFWPEAGVRMGAARTDRLMAALDRLARFAGCDQVLLAGDWLRPAVPPGFRFTAGGGGGEG